MTATSSMRERYSMALNSTNLRLAVNNTGSADVLIAAGWVAKAGERRSMALDIESVISTESMRGANAVAERLAAWVRNQYFRSERKEINPIEAFDVAMRVLVWWKFPACSECNGLGHPVIPGTPHLDGSIECPACLGSGKVCVGSLVKPEFSDVAGWLAGEIEIICRIVFGHMKRIMTHGIAPR